MPVGTVVRRLHATGHPDQTEQYDLEPEDIPTLVHQMKSFSDPRVTVSMELKENNFGKGFGAFVSVSLSCAEDDVLNTYAAASEMTAELVEDAFKKAHATFLKVQP